MPVVETPPCVGGCIRKEYQSKIPSTYRLERDRSCDMPSDADIDAALKRIADRVAAATKTQSFGCPNIKDCECQITPGQKPKWSKWKAIPYADNFRRGECDYTVIQKVKIRSKTFTGKCNGEDEDDDEEN